MFAGASASRCVRFPLLLLSLVLLSLVLLVLLALLLLALLLLAPALCRRRFFRFVAQDTATRCKRFCGATRGRGGCCAPRR